MPKAKDKPQAKTADPDEQLVADVHDAFHAVGYGPGEQIEKILKACHENFRELTRRFAQKMLDLHELQKLDRVMTNHNIDSGSCQWVANVRHLTDNALRENLLETMVEVHKLLRGDDLQQEVWSVLKESYDRLCAQRKALEEQQALAAQSVLVGMPGVWQVGGPVQTPPAGPPVGQRARGSGQQNLPGMPKIP